MLTQEICAERVAGALRRAYGQQRDVPKRLSVKHRFTPRAVENWLYGINAPRMRDLVVLMAECRELEDEVRRLVEEIRVAESWR